ncbi:unnamed protein product, partial [marine sediment metagenome]
RLQVSIQVAQSPQVVFGGLLKLEDFSTLIVFD